MPNYGDEYIVGETYRSSSNPEIDEFQTWLNGPIETGIQNSGGIRALVNPETGDREFLVFYSDSSNSRNQNPWDDVINLEDGVAQYWGDATAEDSPHPDSATGNGWVKEDYLETYAKGNYDDAPPILLFEKPESGKVIFRGLCIIRDLGIQRHLDDGETVVNYLFDLTILDTDFVPLEWIHRKSRTGRDIGGPSAWQNLVDEGRIQQYSIWSKDIRSKDAQLPDDKSGELWNDIRNRLDAPKKGQKLEVLVKLLLEEHENFQDVEITRRSGDKGVDLTGKIDLLSEAKLSGANPKIIFKAQVKNKGSGVSGKELSRLASRIDDGEIGLFFTTSHFTQAAQEENLATYPVRLFSGRDLVDLLVQTEYVENYRLTDEIVRDIEESVL